MVITLESDTSDSDDSNASFDSECKHESGTREPKPFAANYIVKTVKRKQMMEMNFSGKT
jgi:hypothetical protein